MEIFSPQAVHNIGELEESDKKNSFIYRSICKTSYLEEAIMINYLFTGLLYILESRI